MEDKNILKSKLLWVMVAVVVISIAVIVALAAASNATDDMKETPSGDIVDLDKTTGKDDNKTTDEKDTTKREDETTTDDRGHVGDEGVNGDRDDGNKKPGIGEDIKDGAEDIGEDIKDGAEGVGEGIKDGVEGIGEDIKDGVDNIRDDIGNIGSDIKNDMEAGVFPVDELFANTKELQWPVMGNIILDYSMDKTVYFPTLDVYKVNAGIMIQSEVGTKVVAAATGVVKEVGASEEIGNYIIVDMGNGYEATYGQIENISVKAGDKISKSQEIGTVAAPTKYYSIEGCNVYFRLNKDSKPIDPVEYFAY